jgi:hypothetical protein
MAATIAAMPSRLSIKSERCRRRCATVSTRVADQVGDLAQPETQPSVQQHLPQALDVGTAVDPVTRGGAS